MSEISFHPQDNGMVVVKRGRMVIGNVIEEGDGTWTARRGPDVVSYYHPNKESAASDLVAVLLKDSR